MDAHTFDFSERRQWCSFGEIVDSIILRHLDLRGKDVDGRTLPLYFYTDSLGPGH
ncbi:hypothetical protein E4U41_003214, partial [Claviceps citrina]